MRTLFRLAQLLHESLPAKRRVYFIYTHKNGYDRFYNGLKANTEISFWVYKALRKHFSRVRFLRFSGEKPERIARIGPQDVVVGHVGPTFMAASGLTKRLIAFNPWVGDEDHAQEGFNCCPKEVEMAYYDRAASLVLLTSEFNKRVYFDKPTNFWHPYFQSKRVRLVHQPIDLTLFKRIKWDYTTNDFLYIGNKGHMKGVEHAVELVDQVGRQLHLYGLEGKKIDHRNLEQVNRLPGEADFFIQPGLWEAQCVSILEAAARGFIPVVSEETGYPYTHPFLLRPRNFEYNIRVLKDLLNTSSEERRALADSLHAQLSGDVEHNNWKKMTDVIVEEVRLLSA
ncbi:MAG: hypothetical protein S4CHLAM2_09180 [Chlamydiales bacterium]|nr:hypothetical protein [Chlamydiales bacterium]